MQKAVITDHAFETPDIEKSIIEPLGCSVVSQTAFTDPEALIDLVRDADYVITQFAPVDAEVIECMQKCMAIVRYGIGVDNVDLMRRRSGRGFRSATCPTTASTRSPTTRSR